MKVLNQIEGGRRVPTLWMDALEGGARPHSNTDGKRSRLSGQLWEAHKARTWSDVTPNNLQLGQGVDNGFASTLPGASLVTTSVRFKIY